MNSDGKTLRNSDSVPAYKSQILIYNLALGELQGYTPQQGWHLGKWTYTSKGNTFSGLIVLKN